MVESLAEMMGVYCAQSEMKRGLAEMIGPYGVLAEMEEV